MLVLSRKPDESIRVGEEVRLRVLGVRGTRVWIGIDTPQHVHIHRCDDREPKTLEAQRTSAARTVGSS